MYRSTRKPDGRLQERHRRTNELVRETMTIRDAAARYGVPERSLQVVLNACERWEPTPRTYRYYIADIEHAVGEIRRRV